jgi:hypothetical protein
MAARNEQDDEYIQIAFVGLAQPETRDQNWTGHEEYSIFQAGAEQGTESGERLVRIEGCQVINPPVVNEWIEKKQKKKEWVCTFVAPPDLWNQERSDWIQAVTENRQDIPLLNEISPR